MFIPKILKTGYQERDGTYDGKLAYVTYLDAKGVHRKQQSFDGWRNENIPVTTIDNLPATGFVLNKKAGGQNWGWNPRQTYVRVYDPRGMEFEITIPNLMWILESYEIKKGKLIDGELAYAWDGSELLLIPVKSQEYISCKTTSDKMYNGSWLKPKDLTIGHEYEMAGMGNQIYAGKLQEYSNYSWRNQEERNKKDGNPKHVFFDVEKGHISSWSSITRKVLNEADNKVSPLFHEYYLEKISRSSSYSPIVEEHYEYMDGKTLKDQILTRRNIRVPTIAYSNINNNFAKPLTRAGNTIDYNMRCVDNEDRIDVSIAYNYTTNYGCAGYRSVLSISEILEKMTPISKIKQTLESGEVITTYEAVKNG